MCLLSGVLISRYRLVGSSLGGRGKVEGLRSGFVVDDDDILDVVVMMVVIFVFVLMARMFRMNGLVRRMCFVFVMVVDDNER